MKQKRIDYTTDVQRYWAMVYELERVIETCVQTTAKEKLAQSILAKLPELGFVRLENVEIDEGKIKSIIFDYVYKNPNPTTYWLNESDLAKAIASAKPIRVKE